MSPEPTSPALSLAAPTEPHSDESEARELTSILLADRAELWASIAPGLAQQLGNATSALSAPRSSDGSHLAIADRLGRTQRVLLGMTLLDQPGGPAFLPHLITELQGWQALQLGLPKLSLEIELEPGLPSASGGSSHLLHALLTLITLAKETNASKLFLFARYESNGIVLTLETSEWSDALERNSSRLIVARQLIERIGGSLELNADDHDGRLLIRLAPFQRAPGSETRGAQGSATREAASTGVK